MRPILFTIADVPVPAFWTMAVLGFVAAFFVVQNDTERRGYGKVLAYDMILHAYIGGWVGARLFLIPKHWDYFSSDPIGFLLSGSGWVWYGGVIGGALAMAMLARRQQVSLLTLGDIAAPALAIGLGIGRIGCQLSGDGDYGIPTDLPWGMSYPNGVVPTTENVHPTPVYEMLACFLLFAYLWRKRLETTLAPGVLFGQYLIAAGVIRFVVEFVRRNPFWFLGLSTAQWISLILCATGALLIWRTTTPATPQNTEETVPATPEML